MKIINGQIFTHSGDFKLGEVHIEEDRITKVLYYLTDNSQEIVAEEPEETIKTVKKESEEKTTGEKVIDAKGAYVIPGLIDTHIHGAIGHDFCDKDIKGLSSIAAYLKRQGITAFCPTSMTLLEDALVQIFETAKAALPSECAEVVGIHMEGPFLSKEKKGAQNEAYLRIPSIEMYHKLQAACDGKIKIITIAPEIEQAEEFIRAASKSTNISVGHTTANYETADHAFASGANRVTHLYNAMPPFTHRDPGVVGAAFDHKEAYVELICDGIHVHPSVVRATFEMFGADRVVLVSDAMMAMGMEAGEYELGGQKVFMKNKRAVLADGTIAGSATNLMDCMRTCVSMGIPLNLAVMAVTQNPAKSIQIFDEMGSIEEGKKANINILSQNLELIKVIMNGNC